MYSRSTCSPKESNEIKLIFSNSLGTILQGIADTGARFLKGPKCEIFDSRVFAQIRPIWIGDLGTRPKNPKKLGLGP